MLKMFVLLQTFFADRDDEGATAVEYGLMVSLIAGVIVVVVTLLGTKLSTVFVNVTSQIK